MRYMHIMLSLAYACSKVRFKVDCCSYTKEMLLSETHYLETKTCVSNSKDMGRLVFPKQICISTSKRNEVLSLIGAINREIKYLSLPCFSSYKRCEKKIKSMKLRTIGRKKGSIDDFKKMFVAYKGVDKVI